MTISKQKSVLERLVPANPTIVAAWDRDSNPPVPHPFICDFAILAAVPKMTLNIKGAGFAHPAEVRITICEKDQLIGEAKVNTCGAFKCRVQVPAGIKVGDVVTIRAYIGTALQAVWPIEIIEKFPPLPKF